MNFDLRLPLGALFALFGLILTLTGVFGGDALTKISLGVNINLIWGLVMLVFSAVMLTLALRTRK